MRCTAIVTVAALVAPLAACNPPPPPQSTALPRNVAPPRVVCKTTPESGYLLSKCSEDPPRPGAAAE